MKVELVLSGVLAVSTVCYTVINLMLWFESKAARRQKLTPFIVAYLQPTDSHTVEVLHIKNIGEGHARDVRFKVTKDYNRLGNSRLPLSECAAIKHGVSSFPPQYEVTYYIENWCEAGDKGICDFIELEISYRSIRGKVFNHKYTLPLNELIDQNYSDPPETFLGQIPYYLNKLCTVLERPEK